MKLVRMRNGKKRPLTTEDLAARTGLSKRRVLRGLAELEAVGLITRVKTARGIAIAIVPPGGAR